MGMGHGDHHCWSPRRCPDSGLEAEVMNVESFRGKNPEDFIVIPERVEEYHPKDGQSLAYTSVTFHANIYVKANDEYVGTLTARDYGGLENGCASFNRDYESRLFPVNTNMSFVERKGREYIALQIQKAGALFSESEFEDLFGDTGLMYDDDGKAWTTDEVADHICNRLRVTGGRKSDSPQNLEQASESTVPNTNPVIK
jgi:hypothetical protein